MGPSQKKRSDAADTLNRIRFVQADWLQKGIVRAELASRFTAKANEWLSEHPAIETQIGAGAPSQVFMAGLPEPDSNTPIASEQIDGFDILYFENPITIGESAGLPNEFVWPQLAVVSREDQPFLIVRLEQSPFGTSMLGTLDTEGNHANYGMASVVSQAEFVARSAELAMMHLAR